MTPVETVRTYWEKMNGSDFSEAAQLLADNFTCFWPQSCELIEGRENFVRINRRYPAHGPWSFFIEHLVGDGNEIVSDVIVTDGVVRARVLTFHLVENGRIVRQTEYWPEDFAAPSWRKGLVKKCDCLMPAGLADIGKSLVSPEVLQTISKYSEGFGIDEKDWRKALADARADAGVGIGYALVKDSVDSGAGLYVAVVADRIACHLHLCGSERYEIVQGSGKLFYGEANLCTVDYSIERCAILQVRCGDVFDIPPGFAHQLVKHGEEALIILFACPVSHLAEDRIVLPDLF
jgi:limonene-1,2-epoxide hydrolase/mannose-6-phosphate isomerase-like protein (cupin superfamily)